MSTFKNKVKVEAEIMKETTDAVLVDIDGEEHWIPKSQIDDDSAIWQVGESGVLTISEWIANQKGIAE